jgi:superkiller protein 3
MGWWYLISPMNLHGRYVSIGEISKLSVYPSDQLIAEMYGMVFIQDLIRTIPQSGLAKTFSAYLSSALSAFPPEKSDDADEVDGEEMKREPVDVSQEEILDAMIVVPHLQVNNQEGYNMNPACITTGRILASYYLYNKDYETASEIARSAIESLRKLREDAGLLISAPETALLVTLATSLIHYQAPKHHPQARKLFDAILTRKPDSIDALVGKGRVALEAGDLQEALDNTTMALEINPSNIEAKMEHAWTLVLLKDIDNGKRELEETIPLIDGRDPHSRDTIAEIYWRIGKCHWDQGISPQRQLIQILILVQMPILRL